MEVPMEELRKGPRLKLSREDLLNLCEIYKAKALEEHEHFRKWRDRALEAEARLAIYEGGSE